jgi:hypothetical protein
MWKVIAVMINMEACHCFQYSSIRAVGEKKAPTGGVKKITGIQQQYIMCIAERAGTSLFKSMFFTTFVLC